MLDELDNIVRTFIPIYIPYKNTVVLPKRYISLVFLVDHECDNDHMQGIIDQLLPYSFMNDLKLEWTTRTITVSGTLKLHCSVSEKINVSYRLDGIKHTVCLTHVRYANQGLLAFQPRACIV
jgi:hypothetical protein